MLRTISGRLISLLDPTGIHPVHSRVFASFHLAIGRPFRPGEPALARFRAGRWPVADARDSRNESRRGTALPKYPVCYGSPVRGLGVDRCSLAPDRKALESD